MTWDGLSHCTSSCIDFQSSRVGSGDIVDAEGGWRPIGGTENTDTDDFTIAW
jgi:hypothetical protein